MYIRRSASFQALTSNNAYNHNFVTYLFKIRIDGTLESPPALDPQTSYILHSLKSAYFTRHLKIQSIEYAQARRHPRQKTRENKSCFPTISYTNERT